jgi:hypothetical protein
LRTHFRYFYPSTTKNKPTGPNIDRRFCEWKKSPFTTCIYNGNRNKNHIHYYVILRTQMQILIGKGKITATKCFINGLYIIGLYNERFYIWVSFSILNINNRLHITASIVPLVWLSYEEKILLIFCIKIGIIWKKKSCTLVSWTNILYCIPKFRI